MLFVAAFAVVEVVIANRGSNAYVHRGLVNVLSSWDQVLEGLANALSFAELIAVAQVTLNAFEAAAAAAAALGPVNVLASAYHHKELETSISPWR